MSYEQPPGNYDGYGQQPGYGEQPYNNAPVQQHPKATLSLVLGIVGLLCCGPVGIAAFVIGKKTEQEIKLSNGQFTGEGMAKAGKILGIIAMVLMVLGIIFWIFAFATGGVSGSFETNT